MLEEIQKECLLKHMQIELHHLESQIAKTIKKNYAKKISGQKYKYDVTTVNKVQLASLNDKRYYFSDGIVSLPFGHVLVQIKRL